jgi:plastocyanin
MIVFEYFIASSNTIYAMPAHLEITRTGFSPVVMSISASDQLRLSNTSDDVPQTFYVSSATSAQGTPDQLLRPGLTLQPGQSVNVAFSHEGTFTITSAGNPAMTVTITVGPGDSGMPDTFPGASGMVPSQTVSY